MANALILILAATLSLPSGGGPSQAASPETPGPVGVYRFADGRLIGLRAQDEGRLRWVDYTTGESHLLHPGGPDRYRSADDWASETPVAYRYRLVRSEEGGVEALEVDPAVGPSRRAARVRLPTRSARFTSGDVRLHGRLILPEFGSGPYAVVVFVHGSDSTAAVGRVAIPEYWAANGVAAFVYDKRGTGRSEGEYTQRFSVLASDLVAAVGWLSEEPGIDPDRIGVAGFSQGGWVAPLAASMEPAIRFAFVGYGLAMTVADEDRLEAPLKLRVLGFDDVAVREFEELNAAVHEAARSGFPDAGWERIEAIVEQYRDRAWMEALPETRTWSGTMIAMGLEEARRLAPALLENSIEPFYDPVPTLESLEIPMMWAIAAEDIEAPPGPTIEVLTRLESAGKPIDLVVFPGTDHGMIAFDARPDGGRTETGYAPGYFCMMMEWLRQRAGVADAVTYSARPRDIP